MVIGFADKSQLADETPKPIRSAMGDSFFSTSTSMLANYESRIANTSRSLYETNTNLKNK
jgi:hypothetical protein